MAQPAAVLSVLVTANTKMATRGLMRFNTQLAATDAQAGKSKAAIAGLAKTAGKAGAVGALVGLGYAAKKAFGEFREAEKVTKQTNAVLKSTGGQAKVTAKQIENLANKISLKAGIDDEAIQSGENLLLTFTKIRNETGKGNKIFDRATQTITDMSVALDQDLKSSAIQVGKALQDPEKGITALRRVGVNFTQTQSDMIKKWVDHGHQLKAQKFILKELTTEFGGSAAAQADNADKLKVAWENLFETLGRVIGPTIERWMGALARFLNQMQSGKGAGGDFVRVIKDIGAVLKVGFTILKWWIPLLLRLPKLWFAVGKAGINAGKAIWEAMKSTFNFVKKLVGDVIAGVLRRFATLFDVAAKLPFIGKKFAGIAEDIRRTASRVDQLGEEVKGLKSKSIKITVKAAMQDFRSGNFKPLVPQPDGWGLQSKVDAAAKAKGSQWLKDNPVFGPVGPLGMMGAGAVDAFTPYASRFGLSMTSGFRPGAITDSGNLSYHALNRARDYADGAGPMLAFARFMASTFGGRLKELIHTPLGFSIKNGQRVAPYSQSAHYNHVHVAMAKGGTTTRKVRALVGEEGPEIVDLPVGARVHPFSKSKRMVARMGGMLPGFAAGGWVRAATAGRAAGFKGKALQYLLAIGGAESGNYTSFVGDGGQSFSPWQIYHPAHPQYDTHRLLSDWTYAARAAFQISSGGRNWSPWTMFNNGGYRGYMGRAASAIAQTADKVRRKVAPKRKATKKAAGGKPQHRYDARGARDAFMQAFADQLSMRDALAALTSGTADDVAVATDAVRGWQAWLDLALRKHDQSGITTAATELKSWRDRLTDLNAPPPVSESEAARAAVLQQLLSEANLRTAVSQAQYGVLKYGGQFATGGMVPGPLGSPRVIVAHGGETVTPPGAGGVEVHIHGDIINTPRGKKPVEVRDIRVRSRPLPGRGGG